MTEPSHDNTPAELIRSALLISGEVTFPPLNVVWPCFVDHFPDSSEGPLAHDLAAVCIYDTAGTRDGRIMRTGESVQHPGWQVRVRGLIHKSTYIKIKCIKEYLDTVLRLQVEISPFLYTIQAVTVTGNIISLGRELGGQRRVEFTLNGTLSFTPIATTSSTTTTGPP